MPSEVPANGQRSPGVDLHVQRRCGEVESVNGARREDGCIVAQYVEWQHSGHAMKATSQCTVEMLLSSQGSTSPVAGEATSSNRIPSGSAKRITSSLNGTGASSRTHCGSAASHDRTAFCLDERCLHGAA